MFKLVEPTTTELFRFVQNDGYPFYLSGDILTPPDGLYNPNKCGASPPYPGILYVGHHPEGHAVYGRSYEASLQALLLGAQLTDSISAEVQGLKLLPIAAAEHKVTQPRTHALGPWGWLHSALEGQTIRDMQRLH